MLQHHRRRGGRSEGGFTLIELGITTALLGLVLSMLVQSMLSVQTAVNRQSGRNDRNDRLRVAIFAIERQVRSGNVFSDPALASNPAKGIHPNMSVRVFTQANAASAADARCVEWRIHESRLESRDWSPQWAVNGQVTGWRIAADGIRNREVSPPVPAFVLPTNGAYGRRLLLVSLVADGRGNEGFETNTQRIDSAITGRNTGFGYPVSICDDAPPYPT